MRMLAEEPGAKLLAGGQSLMPMLNLRVTTPSALIDINRIAELSFITIERGETRIGALTRHRTLETSPAIRAALPILARAAAEIGHLAIRNRGTIGGSLVHADPAAEWPLLAILLDAKLVARSMRGARTIGAREFFSGPMTSAIEPDEILTEIRFPIAPPTTRFGFAEVCRRRGDFAIVAVACAIGFDSRNRCVSAKSASVARTLLRLSPRAPAWRLNRPATRIAPSTRPPKWPQPRPIPHQIYTRAPNFAVIWFAC